MRLFTKFDTNADGRLSCMEFAEALKFLTKMLGTTLPNKFDAESIFGYLDTDSDRTISR
jgi:Ca2+-binding EF-hand superfamily protein